MSERNDDGTYAPATPAEPLTGQLGVEADHGFKPMPDPKRDDEPEESTIEAEAFRLALSREQAAAPEDAELQYLKPDGTKVDEKETISIEKASKDLSAYHAAIDENRAQSVSAEFAAEIDKMRADAIKENPALAEHFGLDAKEVLAKDGAPPVEKTANAPKADSYAPTDGLDPVLEKQIRENPAVRQMLEGELTRSAAVQEQYSQALATANQFARAAFAEVVPEIASLPSEHVEGALHLLSQTNPARFNAAINTLTRVAQIQVEQQRMAQQQAAVQQYQFQEFAKAEVKKFHQMVDADTLKAIGPELSPYFEELGVSNDELANLWKTQPWIRSAAGQKIIADAVRFRLSQKQSSDWKAKATAKPLPPVQRPGTRSTNARADDASSSIRALERQLDGASGNKALQIAAKLQAAKRARG
jgi:hypothetical protein